MVDLGAQIDAMGEKLRNTVFDVIDRHQFVLGPEVAQLEEALASRTGAADVVTCANGTDALVLALRALDLRPGDHVVVPAFTFAATAEAVVLAGGVPVFADIRSDTFNIDAESLRDHLPDGTTPQPVGVVAVDLFGHPALDASVNQLAAEQGWWVLVDAAQSYGASFEGRRAGSLGSLATTSFFPAKPLGCFGDGGAVFCPDGSRGELLRSLRNHGAGVDRYENVRIGTNSRLDTLQAAVLLAKLDRYDEEHARRRELAARYAAAFAGSPVVAPVETSGAVSAWAQYTVRVPRRDAVVEHLTAAGIGTSVYYRSTLADQAAFAGSPVLGDLSVARAVCADVVSIPIHPYLSDADQDRCIAALLAAVDGCGA
jgi:dTDP-4-amino-4,6-dideoxygalactose transaminase